MQTLKWFIGILHNNGGANDNDMGFPYNHNLRFVVQVTQHWREAHDLS